MKKMKRLMVVVYTFICCLFLFACTKEEKTGTIYGTVRDRVTNEPVKAAGVELMPIGLKTVTGSDGTFTFPNIEWGEYELYVTKTGYVPTKKSGIQLKGTSALYDVQIEQQTSALHILDDQGEEINTLDFGDEADDVSRLFNIYNDSEEALSWQITKTANWIESVSATSGTLQAGGKQGIIVVINRNDLQQGENTTTMHITSDNGNKQLTIKAIGGIVSTCNATAITESTAIIHGKILQDVPYTEKGFVYGANHNLNHNISVGGNGVGEFPLPISIDATSTWHYKAYCIYNGTTYYGVEKFFGPYYNDVPYFQYGGHLYMVAPDPGYGMRWDDAKNYCEGFTMYGYSDWHLPTRSELLQMYADRYSIGGFDLEVKYWSSTYEMATPTNMYYYVSFIDGHTSWNTQNTQLHVRPIRVCY